MTDGNIVRELLARIEEKNQRIDLILQENPELADGGVGGAASAEPLAATPVKLKTAASTSTQAKASAKADSTEEWKVVSKREVAVQLVAVEMPFNYTVSAVHNFRDFFGMDHYCFATFMMEVGDFLADQDMFEWTKKGCVWNGCTLHTTHDTVISRITKMFAQKSMNANINKRKLIHQFRYLLNKYNFAEFNGYFENGVFVEDVELRKSWHETAQRIYERIALL